jgi:hypothetical protein
MSVHNAVQHPIESSSPVKGRPRHLIGHHGFEEQQLHVKPMNHEVRGDPLLTRSAATYLRGKESFLESFRMLTPPMRHGGC